jgi:hypothetical protein
MVKIPIEIVMNGGLFTIILPWDVVILKIISRTLRGKN